MKDISKHLAYRLSRAHVGLNSKSVKWDEVYDTEEELLSDMMLVDTGSNKTVKGYMYIESFQKQYTQKGSLTEKQMLQLKRLAYEIAYIRYVAGM